MIMTILLVLCIICSLTFLVISVKEKNVKAGFLMGSALLWSSVALAVRLKTEGIL